MRFIDAIIAILIFGVFLFGFSQGFMPVYNAWKNATEEYYSAHTIHFIAETFKNECAKPDRNMENWKNAIAAAKELESYEIIELKQGNVLRALMAVCIIAGESLEIIALCSP
jgi:hypothetical protein